MLGRKSYYGALFVIRSAMDFSAGMNMYPRLYLYCWLFISPSFYDVVFLAAKLVWATELSALKFREYKLNGCYFKISPLLMPLNCLMIVDKSLTRGSAKRQQQWILPTSEATTAIWWGRTQNVPESITRSLFFAKSITRSSERPYSI